MFKSIRNCSVVLCVAIFLMVSVGCSSSPKIDASTEASFKTSVTNIMNSLPNDKKESFKNTFTGMAVLVSLAKQGDENEIRKFFDGMTYDDVMAKADELRAKMKESKK